MTSTEVEAPPTPTIERDDRWRMVLEDFFASPVGVAALGCLLLIVGAAVLAPWIAPQNPYDLVQLDLMDSRLAPGSQSMSSGMTYWLGTDGQGRDMLSAILYGLRISIAVGLASGVAALALGIAVGLVASYFGGRVDSFLMRIVDIQLSFPTILVALVLLAVLGQGIDKVIIALIIVQWAYYARSTRGVALAERQKEYIEASRCLNLGHARILALHLLPNCMTPLIVIATIRVGEAIGLEATLSFLGIGVPVTEPSLGLLIANGFNFMLSGYYWISIFPGLALVALIVSINLVGDRMRDVLDPRFYR
jgi:peptide/nickel transport system permease protein